MKTKRLKIPRLITHPPQCHNQKEVLDLYLRQIKVLAQVNQISPLQLAQNAEKKAYGAYLSQDILRLFYTVQALTHLKNQTEVKI